MKQYYVALLIKKENLKALSPDILVLNRSDKQDYLFISKVDAIEQAEKLAKENPGNEVIVMHAIAIIDTEIPKIFKRQFNEKGELLPDDE